MVLNTQSYMWDGLDWVGYLLGPTLRAPYGAKNVADHMFVNVLIKETLIFNDVALQRLD